MNINQEIIDAADRFGLEAIATGGGCDYIYKLIKGHDGFKGNACMVLSSCMKDGSPETMDEPCIVTIHLNHNWTLGVTLQYDTVTEAMQFMSKSNAQAYDYEEYISDEFQTQKDS
jgi:hypothetical protein